MKIKQIVNHNIKKHIEKKKESREKNIDTRAGYGPTENFFSGRV